MIVMIVITYYPNINKFFSPPFVFHSAILSWPKAGYTFSNMDAGPPGNCGNGQHLAGQRIDGELADLMLIPWDLWMIYGDFMLILC